ncbi:tetracycline resistance MFS efflux pump [Nibrella saemangeumensis]|uniref:Tetracycline resistance MFS efflux pump n=1 Tax=Nibrella saemangeumensis TaxID=1084526 RepID=A0ABP8MDG6_9BACT
MKGEGSARQLSLTTIFFTVFLDLVGVGIAIPIITPLMIRPESGVLPIAYPEEQRTILLGFLIASFSIAGFFGGPLLGALSDRYGRRPLLLFSLVLTLVGYLVFALGIHQRNIAILFLSRIIYGLGGGNVSIIQSAIADRSDEQTRTKNFGLIGVAFGLGFIIGPFLGGVLSNPDMVSWFSFETPFLAAALLSLINILLVYLNFHETLPAPVHRPVTALTGFRNLKEAFANDRLRVLFLGVFFYSLGFNFYTQFFQVFLVKRFDYNQVQIGNYFAFVGLSVAFMQGAVVRRVARIYTPQQILRVSVLGLSFALWLFLLPQQSWQLFLIVPVLAVFQGLTSPNSTSLVSMSATTQEQGKIMGINQSVLSAAFSVPPIIAAYIDTISIYLPIIVAGFMVLIGWYFFYTFIRSHANPPINPEELAEEANL